MTNINIAYIGGGSRGWAWGLMSDLAAEQALCGTVRLYDIDGQAAKNNEIIGNKYATAAGSKSAWQYKAVNSLKEALKGADFVIISILPGTFDEMESDVHTPEKYGIYQSVGDSTGPGGLMRAYRTIPMYIEIAQAIQKYSPEAWVINYTNPMTLCVRTLYEVFPQIKAFGCCHEVFGTQGLLAKIVADAKGIEEPRREDIQVNVQGINHFTWINKAMYHGEDIFPLYAAYVDKYYEEGYEKPDEKDHWKQDTFACAERVKFDLFKRYGVIAAAGDRHLAEFCPPWYLKSPAVVAQWKFGLTTVASRKVSLNKRLEKSKKLIEQTEPFELNKTGEDGVKQIKALLGLNTFITNVNIPNVGQIPNLPIEAVVETNAIFSHNSVTPVNAGEMQWTVKALVERVINNQETIIKAVFNKDKELGFCAFANDPLMSINIADARKLYEEMIENTKKYIPWID